MTLQDFFISGLPTGGGNNETKPHPSTITTERRISTQSDHEKNRLKIDQRIPRPSNTTQKPATPKRIEFSKEIVLYKTENSF